MNAVKMITGSKMEVSVKGKLDAVSAPKFEADVTASLDGITELYINLRDVEYISSAGLRVLLYLQQIMNEQGKMVVRNVPQIVNDIFELTGFYEVVTVE